MTDEPLPDFDAMWDYDDPAGTEARFREILPAAEESGDQDYLAQLLTQIARAQGLQRKFEEAHATLDRIERMIGEEQGVARVRWLLERGRVFNSSGHPERAKSLFIEAWKMARAISEDALAVDAAHMLAIVEPGEGALEWNGKALELAQDSNDPRAQRWLGSLHNNIGWTHHERGDYETALAHFEAALKERKNSGKANDIRIARWCIARCLRSLGQTEEALAIQRELERAPAHAKDPDGFICEEMAECLLILGRRDEARPYFKQAHESLSQDPWLREREPQRIERLRTLASD